MSRVGRLPIPFTDKLQVSLTPENVIQIKSSKGAMNIALKGDIKAQIDKGQILLTRDNNDPQNRAFHGLFRSLVFNAVTGLEQGFTKKLILNGVGYRVKASGKNLELFLGYSHPLKVALPDGIEAKVEKQNILLLSGYNKELLGQIAAKIRAFRPPEPFLGKGVRYADEVLRRKAGKSTSSK